MSKENINSSTGVRRKCTELESDKGIQLLTFAALKLEAKKLFANPLLILLTRNANDEQIQFYEINESNWKEGCEELERMYYVEFRVFVCDATQHKVTSKKRSLSRY
jgi:hypothetical protein